MNKLIREVNHGTTKHGPLVTQLRRTGPRAWLVICDLCKGTPFAATEYRDRVRAEAAFEGHARTFEPHALVTP